MSLYEEVEVEEVYEGESMYTEEGEILIPCRWCHSVLTESEVEFSRGMEDARDKRLCGACLRDQYGDE